MKRNIKNHLHNMLIILLTLGVVGFINFISSRHYKRFDFTENLSHTLSDQSIKIAKGLKKNIKLIGFFQKKEKQVFHDLVDKYIYYNEKISKEFADPEVSVGLAELHGIRKAGVIVVQGSRKTLKVEEITEEALTNAIIKATSEKDKKFYFVTGHLEKSLENKENQGYSDLKKELESAGYVASELLLLKEGKIPQDCDVLVIAGEQKPYLPNEIVAIEQYLEKGGSLFLALDPHKKTSFEKIIGQWGVELHNDIVIDKESRILGGDFLIPLIYSYSDHEIMKSFQKAKAVTFFPITRSFDKKDTLPEGVAFKFLAKTSQAAWGETEAKNKKVSFDPKKDFQGPLTVAAVLTKKESQLVLFGTSHIATNTFLSKLSNRDLILNTLSWLARDTNMISIRAQKKGSNTMTLTPAQGNMIGLISILAIPLSIIFFGVFYWFRRRKK